VRRVPIKIQDTKNSSFKSSNFLLIVSLNFNQYKACNWFRNV
jgi:hypothetical protein